MGERKKLGAAVVAAGVCSYAALAYEVFLLQVFSVILNYHYVFAIVSFALFGLGIGALVLERWQRWFPRLDFRLNLGLFALAMLISFLLIIKLPVYKSPELVSFRAWLDILLASVPFLFAGIVLSDIFQQFARRSSLLYGADLIGGAAGALSVVWLFNLFPAYQVNFILVFVVAAASLAVGAFSQKRFWIPLTVLILLSAAFAFSIRDKTAFQVPVAMDSSKDMFRYMKEVKNARIVDSRWSAFGRTDLIYSPSYPDEMTLYINGAAGSPMYRYEAAVSKRSSSYHLLRHHFGESFPFLFLKDSEKNSALIIGPGGGRDVLVALFGKVDSITAVEVNPDFVEIVKDYEDFNGGIYSKFPNVKVVVEEGRKYLQSVTQKYDLIMMALPLIKSSHSVEGYALTENYLFTVEAFRSYLDHLTPEGRIVIVAHMREEIYRLLSVTLQAFLETGVREAETMKRVYVLGTPMMPTIVIKKTPFTEKEAKERHRMLHAMSFDRGSYYLPYVKQATLRTLNMEGNPVELRMFDQFMVDIEKGERTLDQFVNAFPFNVRPVWDDHPFFYQFEFGLPSPFPLFAFLIISALGALLGFMLLPKDYAVRKDGLLKALATRPPIKVVFLMFVTLGAAFMVLEISLFQKLMIYVGRPIFALSLLLFSLLVGTSVGSLTSSLVKKSLEKAVVLSSIAVALLAILYALFFRQFYAFPLNEKVLTVLLLVPLGFFLGMPFPLLLRWVKRHGAGEIIHFFWGINGVASVFGSALAMIVGILLGFSYGIFLSAILYLGIAVMALLLKVLAGAGFSTLEKPPAPQA